MFVILKRIFRTAWQGLIRNNWLSIACISMLTISLMILGSILIFNNVSHNLIDVLEEKMDVSIYFNREVPEEDILKIRNELIGNDKIAKIEYVSQEEALKRFEEKSSQNQTIMKALEELGENPLVAFLSIKAKDTSYYSEIIEEVNNSSFKDKLMTVGLAENQRVIERINALSKGIKFGSFFIIIIATILSVLISFNTIRMAIYSLRGEIEIMKLVGASNWFIRGPFLLEGAIYGLTASVLAIVIFMPLVIWISPKLETFVSEISISSYFWSHFWFIFGIQTLFGIGLGMIAGFWAMNKYLKA
ncbi:MAG: permease-like cell division protein FtsX [Candidatus Pacebacteria bacterium]|nr:permease-like cell division protein FtsX [Candidatus Paceibacterota bacterium]